MPKQVVVLISCSKCGVTYEEGDPNIFADFVLQVGPIKVGLDLCSDCQPLLLKATDKWVQLGERITAKLEATPRSHAPNPDHESGRWPCDYCERDFPTRGAASNHMTRTHGVTAAMREEVA
jgi:hypothetical protein